MISRVAVKVFNCFNTALLGTCRFMRFGSEVSGSGSPLRAPVLVMSVILIVFFVASGLVSPSRDAFFPGARVDAFSESISTFASDCTTPKAAWNLGQTACAAATGAPDDRRIVWVAPNGLIAQIGAAFTGTANDSYNIPTGADPFAQVGTWTVATIDNNGVGFSNAQFVVRDPNNLSVNLSVGMFGPFEASPGSNVAYRVEVTNNGPDDAQDVVLTDSFPANATFLSEVQTSGPTFTCAAPSGGQITCSISSLAPGATAIFSFAFTVGTSTGSVVTNTASISSSTSELHPADNTASVSTTISGGTPQQCTVNCPSPISVSTTSCSAIVTYATPSTTGDCSDPDTGQTPAVVCSPPSNSSFPVGVSTVTCASGGNSCSFTVTVNFTGQSDPLTVTCPADVTVNEENPTAGTATVTYPSPTTTGSCVSVVCSPPSGSTFSVGATVVTCVATDAANNSATCTFTVTVNSGSGCAITCPDNITQAAPAGQCNAVVTYADPTTAGNCGTVTCVPPSGSTFQVGTTPVNCSSTTGASCSFTATVTSSNALTDLGAAQVWVGLKNSDDVGTKFDLLAEVFRNGVVVGSGQVNDVPGGSSGFNNAILDMINVALDGSADFCTGDTIAFRLSVRVAASSGHVSGTARLWFNDSAANSRFNATLAGAASDYFLLDGFVLNNSAGSGPKKTIDVLVNRNSGGNPFKPFGTWSKTF